MKQTNKKANPLSFHWLMKTLRKNKGSEKIEFKADSLTIFTNYSPLLSWEIFI